MTKGEKEVRVGRMTETFPNDPERAVVGVPDSRSRPYQPTDAVLRRAADDGDTTRLRHKVEEKRYRIGRRGIDEEEDGALDGHGNAKLEKEKLLFC